MNRKYFLLMALLSSISLGETIEHNGQMYEIDVEAKVLTYQDFTLSTGKRSLSFNIRESKIPYGIIIGHYGLPPGKPKLHIYVWQDKEQTRRN